MKDYIKRFLKKRKDDMVENIRIEENIESLKAFVKNIFNIYLLEEKRKYYFLKYGTSDIKKLKIQKAHIDELFKHEPSIIEDMILIKTSLLPLNFSEKEKFILILPTNDDVLEGYLLITFIDKPSISTMHLVKLFINNLLLQQRNKFITGYLEKILEERDNTEKEISNINRQLIIMQQLTNLLHADLEIDEVLDYIAKGVQKALGYGVVLISLLNEKEGVFERRAQAGIDEENFKNIQKVKPSREYIETLFREEYKIGGAYFIRHTYKKNGKLSRFIERFTYTLEEKEILKGKNSWHPEDLFIVPFYGSNGNILGIMTVDKPFDGLIPNKEKVEMMEVFTRTAAMAMEKAQMYMNMKRFVYTLETVSEVSAIITGIMDMEKLLKKAVNLIKNRFGYDNVAVMLKKGKYLEMTVYNGYREVDEQEINARLKEGKGVTYWVMKYAQPVKIDDVRQDERFIGKVKNARAEIAIPLKAPMGIVGVLNVEKDGYASLDEYDMKVLSIIGSHLGVAIDNAIRYTDTEKIAMTDAMTGIYNYRFFITHLEKEINKANRKGYSISLLMIDADNFKWYNDTYGHLVGDKVIQQLVELLEDSVRKGDMVTRYGGDEFVVILPGASKDQSLQIARRIKKQVEDYTFVEGAEKPLTVSIGVATYPEDAEDLFTLLDNVDKALYKAKHEGKNTITVFSKEKIT